MPEIFSLVRKSVGFSTLEIRGPIGLYQGSLIESCGAEEQVPVIFYVATIQQIHSKFFECNFFL